MNSRRRAAWALTTLSLLLPLALAAPTSDAYTALMGGQVDTAVKLLREKQDAPSLVLLARAYVGQSLFTKAMADKKRLYQASETAARQAVSCRRHQCRGPNRTGLRAGLAASGRRAGGSHPEGIGDQAAV